MSVLTVSKKRTQYNKTPSPLMGSRGNRHLGRWLARSGRHAVPSKLSLLPPRRRGHLAELKEGDRNPIAKPPAVDLWPPSLWLWSHCRSNLTTLLCNSTVQRRTTPHPSNGRAMQQFNSTRRVKAGNGHAAAAARRGVFVQAYMANGHNATQAAITAGYSAKTAYSQGQRLLKHVEVSGQLAEMAREAGKAAGLTIERVLEEVRRLSFSDPRKLFRRDGTPIPIAELDENTAAMISAIEVDATGRLKRIRLWDKNAALEKAMKHLGLFKCDNAQQRESLVLRVEAAKPVKRGDLESL